MNIDVIPITYGFLTLSLPESIMKTCGVVLTFESIMETCSVVLTFGSVDEILWRDHLNETSLAVLLHGTICFSILYKTSFRIFLEF